jgi:CopG family nickel-responsive transcriptional regulator
MGIVSFSIPQELLEEVDNYVREQGFANRSEILRQALRAFMSEGRKLGENQEEILAVITVIYRRGARTGKTTDIQHGYSDILLTFLHTHIEKGNCIEIIVAKGDSKTMKEFIAALKANKYVSEVKVTLL